MTLAEIIKQTKQRVEASPNKPVIIMVAGGSASGKSSQVLPQLMSAFGDKALLVEQDWYQLGVRFAEKDESPYKWDDPRNFQIDLLATDLKKLSAGETVSLTSFDVVAVDAVDERTLKPHPVIIVDGIYSLYGSLAELADFSVYVTMPFYGRFLRRLFRMIYDQKQDKPQTTFKQVFGGVLRAHRDLVSKQEQIADCIIHAPYDFASTIERYHMQPTGTQLPKDAKKLWEHSDGLAFWSHQENDSVRMYIVYGDKVYYDFMIAPEYTPLLKGVDYTAE